MEHRTTVVLGGRTATGRHVPDEVVEAPGAGRRPPVRVTVGGHTDRTTVSLRAGRKSRQRSVGSQAASASPIASGESSGTK